MNKKTPITDALLLAISASGISHKALERETGVKRQSIMRFVRGDQTLRLDIADKLAEYFGVKITIPKPQKSKGQE